MYIVFVICNFGNLLPTLYSSGALLEDDSCLRGNQMIRIFEKNQECPKLKLVMPSKAIDNLKGFLDGQLLGLKLCNKT